MPYFILSPSHRFLSSALAADLHGMNPGPGLVTGCLSLYTVTDVFDCTGLGTGDDFLSFFFPFRFFFTIPDGAFWGGSIEVAVNHGY